MTKQLLNVCCLAVVLGCGAFSPVPTLPTGRERHFAVVPSRRHGADRTHHISSGWIPLAQTTQRDENPSKRQKLVARLLNRFDTLQSAGISDALTAGPFSRVKKLHDPKTYLVLAALAGFRWDWCFRNPYYWFAVGFCIKWYRARYVFKIPVWDRQPNWNNIITSKEQEKDLKAYTCKKCGSTIFIAKTREFFFEGDTGIGGLGCFSCGAKGKENFVMDRDRIVEDVADMDDYFEYERPLDFVSRAERRKLMKEAAGDEEKANQLLMERQQNGDAGDGTVVEAQAETVEEETNGVGEVEESSPESVEPGPESASPDIVDAQVEFSEDTVSDEAEESVSENMELEEEVAPSASVESVEREPSSVPESSTPVESEKVESRPSKVPVTDDDIFDALDMDI